MAKAITDENKMWNWIQDTTRALCYHIIANRNDAEDIASDVIVTLLKDKKRAEKIYTQGQIVTKGYKYANNGLLIKMIQDEYLYHRIGRYFGEERPLALFYSILYLKILDVCKTYDIQPIPQNAYLIAYGTGIAYIDTVEKILKTTIPMQMEFDTITKKEEKEYIDTKNAESV